MSVDIHKAALPMLYLTSWIKAGSQCGINALEVFESSGLKIDLENIHRHKLKPLELIQALCRCTKASDQRHFPLVLGDTLTFDQVPAAETFLATSSTLRDAFQVVDWVTHFLSPWLNINLEENEDEAWVSIEIPYYGSESAPLRFITEVAMVAIKKIGLNLLGSNAVIRAVHFRHGKPDYHPEYSRHFLMEPKYNQTKNAVFFDRACLDQKLFGAMPQLHAQAYEILRSQLSETPMSSSTFSQDLIDKLRAQPSLAAQGLPAIANALGMSSRTLQRRLNREGQSFSDVLSQARKTLATRWLAETGMDLQSISVRLGYQSRRAFTSAFKQWTGLTPSKYREKQRL